VTAPAVARRWQEPAEGAAIGAVVRDQVRQVRRLVPLGAVWLTALVVHVGVAPHLAVGGVAPDVLMVAVVAVAAGRGPRAGAAFGFAAGLGADLFVAMPLGTSALAFTLVGHGLGRSGRPPSSPGTAAAALCSPASRCFACRTGRLHGARRAGAGAHHEGPIDGPVGVRPTRLQRRKAARRAALQRSVVLSFVGVAAGRLGVAVVATTLAGVPFPSVLGLLEIGTVAAVTAPFGPAAFAAVARLGRPSWRP
jgi:hypothetical protein